MLGKKVNERSSMLSGLVFVIFMICLLVNEVAQIICCNVVLWTNKQGGP